MSQLKTQNPKLETASALGVVILGAGASVRMGQPKLLLPWRDTTVIGQILSDWRESGAAQIAIVMRPNDVALATELDRLGLEPANRIENPQPEQGMFSSILCAANWSGWRSEICHWAIVLGDQPHLGTATLRRLLDFYTQNLDKICRPVIGGHTGHPVILPKPAFAELKRTRAETLKDFLKLMVGLCVQLEMANPGVLLDIDTPEDYIRLQSR